VFTIYEVYLKISFFKCGTRTAYKIVSVHLKPTYGTFVPKMLVPKLTFMYRSWLHPYFVCTESHCNDIDIQCTETGCTEKKHAPKVYVPKLSCTEIK